MIITRWNVQTELEIPITAAKQSEQLNGSAVDSEKFYFKGFSTLSSWIQSLWKKEIHIPVILCRLVSPTFITCQYQKKQKHTLIGLHLCMCYTHILPYIIKHIPQAKILKDKNEVSSKTFYLTYSQYKNHLSLIKRYFTKIHKSKCKKYIISYAY